MQKFFIVLAFFICTFGRSYGQKTSNVFLELGGVRSSFQDLKYSSVRYNGLGAQFNLGFQHSSRSAIWGFGLNLQASTETTKLHENGTSLAVSPMFQLKYLRGFSDKLYLGAKWDVISGNYRNVDGLGNNGNYLLSNSSLFAAGVYKMDKFEFGIDLALLSSVKEIIGFAFSAPQKALEEGEFDYQNTALINPLPLAYSSLRTPNRHFVLRTHINYQLSKRFSVSYNWSMRKFAEVKGYGTIIGSSAIAIRWNLTSKQKETAQN